MATAVVAPWQPHHNGYFPPQCEPSVSEQVSIPEPAVVQAEQTDSANVESQESADASAKASRSAPTEFDPFYGRRAISELCERVIASLFECSLDSTAASMGAKACEQRPTHRLSEFIAYALYRTRLPVQVTYQALYLLKRLKSRYPGARGSSGHRLFISALMLASKSTCDDTYSNKSWTIVGQGLFTLREVNQMERELFSYLGYRVNVANEPLQHFIDGLESGRFRTAADLLGCNVPQPAVASEEPAAAEQSTEQSMAATEQEVESQEPVVEPIQTPEAATVQSSPAPAFEASPVEVSCPEVTTTRPDSPTKAEPTSIPDLVETTATLSTDYQPQQPAAAVPQRSSSIHVPRSRSAYSFTQMQRASIAGYPMPVYGSGHLGAPMSASMSTPGLPTYLASNSAPSTCSAPVRHIGGYDARSNMAPSHYRTLHTARDRCRPYTMPPQTAHLHPLHQPYYAMSHSPQRSGTQNAERNMPYYPSEYLSASQSRSPSARSTFSSFSGSSYASSDDSASTSPSLYESRSQSSGFTTPETSDMELSNSPFEVSNARFEGQRYEEPEYYRKAEHAVSANGPTAMPLDYLQSHPAFAAMHEEAMAAMQKEDPRMHAARGPINYSAGAQ
ncbi:hypothetical protein OC845_001324 [Tilletia horrida]|nr:hypothetical protein OC845_001324 [Tilletia horrida]